MGISSRISEKRRFRYFSSKPCSLLSSNFLNAAQCNSSTGSLSDCCKIRDFSRLPQKKQFFLQPNTDNDSHGFPPSCYFGSFPLLKKHFFSNSASGFSSISQSLLKGSLTGLSKCSISSSSSSIYFCSVVHRSSFTVQKPFHDGRRFCGRLFSVVPSSGSSGMNLLVSEAENSRDCENIENLKDKVCKCDTQMMGKGGDGVDSSPSRNSKIIEIIKNGGKDNDMEIELSLVGSKLPIEAIKPIFTVLNRQNISGLRFFRWILNDNPRLRLSAEVCSLVINNCGFLGDYASMESLLREFRSEKICLDTNAFGFLPVLSTSEDSLVKSVREMIDLLNKVGGSCCNSGICALVEMFCNLDMFEMAKSAIEIAGRRDSLYHILMRQRCKRGHFEEAHVIIRELTVPTVKTYNYLLGCFCKNNGIAEAYSVVEEMTDKGIAADAITFEILIHSSCIQGKMDVAKKLLDKMEVSSMEPRLSTHAALLKAFMSSEQYEEAHNYVIESSVKYKQSSAEIYSLLADLHRAKGNLMAAQGIIVELMDKGLRPSFRVYINIVKQLQKTGRGNLARDFKNRYSKF
ncbi:unnamed protein product [Coffea canephora]|uniref:Pentacotripeptide-repeat region of PRORP domain-containing protein n=1 Tax=Coffea canephora TaxID=49390 RepID=A0A068V8V1_COFCA|nr:unnamed protein product [Coffea canephora]